MLFPHSEQGRTDRCLEGCPHLDEGSHHRASWTILPQPPDSSLHPTAV